MLGNRGIIARQVNGTFELLDSLLILAALIVDPAQTIDVEAVLGLDRYRAPDQLLCLVHMLSLFGVSITQIVQCRCVARIQIDRLLHLLNSELLLIGFVVESAEREMILVV